MNRDLAYRIRCIVSEFLLQGVFAVLLGLSFGSCTSDDYFDAEVPRYSNNGFQLIIGGDVTRSTENDRILEGMRLYCFDRTAVGGIEPDPGSPADPKPAIGGSLLSPYHHVLQGLTRDANILKTNQMRVGKWDMVMVSGLGANIQIPYVSTTAGKALMYTFDPAQNSGKAHEFYHRYHRLPEVTEMGHPSVLSGVSRNVAKVQITVDRAVDIDANVAAGTHTVKMANAPQHISWAGTLLKRVSGGYETSTSDFDVVAPLESSFTFTANTEPGAEEGTYTSNKLTFIIPAHRGADFWAADGQTQTASNLITDTITKRLSLTLSFARPGGRPAFTKEVEIVRVPRCNQILDIHIKMKDSNVEIIENIEEWSTQDVNGDVGAPFLNVSQLETEVYDSWETQLHFWSNQPADKVFVEPLFGTTATTGNVNEVFWELAGAGAFNCEYDEMTGEGRLYLSHEMVYEDSGPGNKEYKINLHAGGLTREITIKSYVGERTASGLRRSLGVGTPIVTNFATRAAGSDGNTTPYVGTFHRAMERGERVVTWQYTGEWNAKAEGDAAVLKDLLVDRLPSPSLAEGRLYGYDPGNAEDNAVTNGGSRLIYRGNVSLRVGWKSAGNLYAPRYARIVVRKGLAVGAGDVIATLYVRQGEAAAPVRDGQRSFLPYNVGKYHEDNYPGANEGLVAFPTQQGYLYWWGKSDAYSPDFTVSYPSWTPNHDGVFTTDVCPVGYRYPTEEEFKLFITDHGATSNYGYYADGYFDRRSIEYWGSLTSGDRVAVGATDKMGYSGLLHYNSADNRSIYFPFGIRRDRIGGTPLTGAGTYWASNSTRNTLYTKPSGSAYDRAAPDYGFSVRCVALVDATLSFDSNAGAEAVTDMPAPITTKETTVIMLPINKPVRTDYRFDGWNSQANGTGTTYAPGATYTMPIGGGKLYAMWTRAFMLSFDGNGADGGITPEGMMLTSGQVVNIPSETPVRTDYGFVGWSLKSTGVTEYDNIYHHAGGRYTTPTISITSKTTLYAIWAKISSCAYIDIRGTGDNATLVVAGGYSRMYFKYGSTVGLTGGDHRELFKPEYVIFNPTPTASFTGFTSIPETNCPQSITSEWHRNNALNGRGDACRLIGIPLSEIKAGNVDNGLWRLPTWIEMQSIANCRSFTYTGMYGMPGLETRWGAEVLWFYSRTFLPAWSASPDYEAEFANSGAPIYPCSESTAAGVHCLEVRMDLISKTGRFILKPSYLTTYRTPGSTPDFMGTTQYAQQVFCVRQ